MAATNKETPIYAIAGPTASGKTALGVDLALLVGGEIINFDSVQIYKGIEIATAKPTDEERRGIPHHLIGYVDPRVNYTAAEWANDAAAKVKEVEERGSVPILVGGTGFYLRTLRDPLFESPRTDAELRHRLQDLNTRRGPAYLHRILTRIDPEAADRLPPNDHVRVIRALEVCLQTGEKFSQQQKDRAEPPEFAQRIRLFVLDPPRAELYDRINSRTTRHFECGLVEEVKHLLAVGVSDTTNALGAHGYRRVCEYLRGERTLESAIERSKQNVRNYAKRQLTWFRREKGAIWIEGFGDAPNALSRLETHLE
ncbi:MAG: tRNA (adenosine(37)-N6)-dimethylallyltransferase MiaA [Acidobacteriota bacterium]